MTKKRENDGSKKTRPEKNKEGLGGARGNAAGRNAAADSGDAATEDILNRLEQMTGGAAEEPVVVRGDMRREFDKLDAETEEEIDALRVNLTQDDDEIRNPHYGTGLVADEVAEEQLAGFTETGRDLEDRGALSVVPGRDDTSAKLRSSHPKTVARADDVLEGNLDEPRDEELIKRKVDDGTAA